MSVEAPAGDAVVVCPNCHSPFPLTSALTGPIEAQVAARLESEYQKRERASKAAVERRIADAVAVATKNAQAHQSTELKALQQQVAEQQDLIGRLEAEELALRKRARDLQARETALAVEVERQVDGRLKAVQEAAARAAQEQHRLKDAEKDRKLSDLRRQLEEATLKAQQGSQQIQGEVAELDVESQLRQAFPRDEFEAISVGQRGADLLQRVTDSSGRKCGRILYEVKNAKAFSEGWIQKLREDQRNCGADIAVLVTLALPKDIESFGIRSGVWIVGLPGAVGLALALRFGLLEVARTRTVAEGRAEKQAALLAYVGGTEFRQRIEGMLDPIMGSLDDLNKERRAIETAWARRQKRLEQLIGSLGGLYGDVGGIIGTLPKLAQLELPASGDSGTEAA